MKKKNLPRGARPSLWWTPSRRQEDIPRRKQETLVNSWVGQFTLKAHPVYNTVHLGPKDAHGNPDYALERILCGRKAELYSPFSMYLTWDSNDLCKMCRKYGRIPVL